MKRKAIPVRTVLTNRRDNESDLGGVTLIDKATGDDRPAPVPGTRDDNRQQNPR